MSLDAWNVSPEILRAPTDAERLRAAVHFAVLAPSSHNTQPWLFRVHGNALEVLADRSRALPVVDPEDRELTISCGAAVAFASAALLGAGYNAWTEVVDDPATPDLLARITIKGELKPNDRAKALLGAIPTRRTHRAAFKEAAVSHALLRACEDIALSLGCWLTTIEDMPGKHALALLIAEGDRLQFASKAFRRELAAWVHSNRTRSNDGIPGYAHGISDLASYAGPWVLRTFDLGDGQAATDVKLAEGSPVLAVLGTEREDKKSWVQAGQVLGTVLLELAVYGVQASFLNQPCEVPELRARLASLAGPRGFPQIVLRIGHAEPARATPRRPVEEVMLGA